MSQAPDIQLAAQTMASNYATVAFVMTLLYDYALTFAEEVEFVWRQKMGLAKMLFLLNRYIPLVDLVILMNSYVNQDIHNEKFCSPWFQIDSWLAVFSAIVIDIMMLLRTWAIWRRSRNILIYLGVILMLCTIVAFGCTLYEMLTVIKIPSPDRLRPCETTYPNPNVFYGVWVSVIVFDSTIVTLTLLKVLPAPQHDQSAPYTSQILGDGVLYFVMIFLASIANIIVISAAPPALATMLVTFYRVISATLCSRLALNIRGLFLRPVYQEEDTMIDLATLVFSGQPSGATTAPPNGMEMVEDAEADIAGGESQRRTGDLKEINS